MHSPERNSPREGIIWGGGFHVVCGEDSPEANSPRGRILRGEFSGRISPEGNPPRGYSPEGNHPQTVYSTFHILHFNHKS